MKKLFKVLLLCGLFVFGTAGCSTDKPEANKNESTTLHITVNNQGKEIFNDDVTVEGEVTTLADFLEAADELDVEMEDDSQYGAKIISILDVETEDWNKGPWWLYESDNNKACQEAGMCDAASKLEIADGDNFTFDFKSF